MHGNGRVVTLEGLRKVLNKVSPRRLASLLGTLTPRAFLALAQSLNNPEGLIREVRDADFYFLIKALGDDRILPLLSLATPLQLRYLADIEFWKKDMLYSDGVAKWLQIFSQLAPEKIQELLASLDPELLVTMLHPFVSVKTRNMDLDYLEDSDTLPSFTMENIFFVDFSSPRLEDPVRTILESLYMADNNYYFALMQCLASGLSTDFEETAIHFRRARLAEKGFPSFDEALEIYQDVGSRMDFASAAFSAEQDSDISDVRTSLPLAYPLREIKSTLLFRQCLDAITDSHDRDRISSEIAYLANKIMVADSLDPSVFLDLTKSLHKASGYINIALQDLGAGEVIRGKYLLMNYHVETLFRFGFQAILSLRREALSFCRKYEGGFENLGYPLAVLLRELFKKRPLFAAYVRGESKSRDFQDKDDIAFIRGFFNDASVEQSWEDI